MKPTLPITDRAFVYTPAHLTNIRDRFDRVRAQIEAQAKVVKRYEYIQRKEVRDEQG